jgi:two-component system sensor histidine kinase SenX3
VIAENAAATVREQLQAGECRFDVAIAPDLPPVRADSGAMVTAIVNLLDNARKYSGDAKHIALTVGARNGSVCFAVRDNGIGISPRDTRRIFRRYVQVHSTHSTSGGGVGLGLSIVKFIVSAHRGDVRVESAPGRGSTFTISLPVAAAAGHHERTSKT